MSGLQVAIIGPGRVGSVLAQALPRAGHRVVAVTGGSPGSRQRLASQVAGTRFTDLHEAVQRADLVVIATPDRAVAQVARAIAVEGDAGPRQRVIHLAGSLGLEVLDLVARTGAGTAALHPAQSVSADAPADALVGAAWAVTARDGDRPWAHELVQDLGGDPHDVRDADRVLYHAALTLGSNAVAAATSTARQLLLAAGVRQPAAFLDALGRRSLANVLDAGVSGITGPVVRGDVETVELHLAALERDLPTAAAGYRHLQAAVLHQVAVLLDDDARAALARALRLEGAPYDGSGNEDGASSTEQS